MHHEKKEVNGLVLAHTSPCKEAAVLLYGKPAWQRRLKSVMACDGYMYCSMIERMDVVWLR